MLLEEDKKLCALVKQYPQLYDKNHKDYGQQKATVEAWKKIAVSLEKSAAKCQERWRNLGAYTCKTKRGRNRDKSFNLAEYMEFLRPHLSKETVEDETLDSRARVNKSYNSRASENENPANEYFIKFIQCHMLNMTPREQSLFRIRIWENACKIIEDGSSARTGDNDDLKKIMLSKIDTASEQELHDLEEKIQQKVYQVQTRDIKT
ncbi:uncharacterized protein LOC105209915 isoform X2 [Zeugodacus cucurbitae]|uniref:uncharacterized protein LOC105209915 isoform X2 n=1 Tax=Zeugodacus cucurbitae TaxID=28588 RepID=UPI0010A74A1B|nr:uncharacterized protein LOC105209915 isoform X2 [Zeugodacus cucurbitae]